MKIFVVKEKENFSHSRSDVNLCFELLKFCFVLCKLFTCIKKRTTASYSTWICSATYYITIPLKASDRLISVRLLLWASFFLCFARSRTLKVFFVRSLPRIVKLYFGWKTKKRIGRFFFSFLCHVTRRHKISRFSMVAWSSRSFCYRSM